MDSNRLCCLCVVKIEQNYNFDIIDDEIYTKIQMHLHLDIKNNVDILSNICPLCIEKVNEFHEYYQQVHCNQSRLTSVLHLSNDKQIDLNTFEAVTLKEDNILLEYYAEYDISKENHKLQTQILTALEICDLDQSIIEENKVSKPHEISDCKSEINTSDISENNVNETTKKINSTRKLKSGRKRKISLISNQIEHTKKTKNSRLRKLKQNPLKESQYKNINKCEDLEPSAETIKEQIVKDTCNKSIEEDDDCGNQGQLDNKDIKPFPKVVFKDGEFQINSSEMVEHIERFYILQCYLCPRTPVSEAFIDESKFSTIKSLFRHYKDVHGVNGYVTCCGKKISRKDMPHHFALHVNPEEFKCKDCDYVAPKHYALKLHYKNMHTSELDQKKFTCSFCNRAYKKAYTLNIHQKEMHNDNNDNAMKYQCKECEMSFFTKCKLQQHCFRKHSEKKYNCDNCGKIFRDRSTFYDHCLSHETNKNVKCDICGTWLKNIKLAKIHYRKIHSSTTLLKCDECNYTSYVKRNLVKHKKNTHSDKKPFSCPYCDFSTKTSCKLNSHLTQHTGIKTKCEYCSQEFLSKANYYNHRRKWHLDEIEREVREKELKMMQNLKQCSSNL